MDVSHERRRLAEREVDRAVVQLVAPDLVEAEADVDRRTVAVHAVQIGREPARGDGVLPHAALEEVPRHRRLGKADELRPRIEARRLSEQRPDASEVARVVALARLELGEGESDVGGHWLKNRLGDRWRATGGASRVDGWGSGGEE